MQEQQVETEDNRYAVMIRVIRIASVKSRKHINEFSLEIQYMRTFESYNIPLSSRKTAIISKSNSVWMEDIYFNNCESNNNFQFTLHCGETVKFEPKTLQGKKIFSNFRQTSEMGKHSLNLRFKDQSDSQIIVEIQISVFSNEDCLVGLQIPQISLACLKQQAFAPQFTAIDIRQPIFNCFSCMDQPILSFNHLECYPTKFKVKNSQKPKQ